MGKLPTGKQNLINKLKLEIKMKTCINCQSENVTQTADHSSNGYNGYHCNSCGQNWGN